MSVLKNEINYYLMRAHRNRSCRRSGHPKTRHATAELAGVAVDVAHAEKPGEHFVSYKCRYCGFWHVGHAKDKDNESERPVSERVAKPSDQDSRYGDSTHRTGDKKDRN